MVEPAGERAPLSTIGRTIDWRVPTNRAIVFVFLAGLVGALAAHLTRGDPVFTALGRAAAFGASLFLTWALTREADPDRWYAAFLAAAGAAVAGTLLGPANLALALWFLLGLRLINRTPGLAPGPIDLLLFYFLSLWLAISIHWMIAALAVIPVPFAATRRLPGVLRRDFPLALLAASGIVAAIKGANIRPLAWRGWGIWSLAAVCVALAPIIATYRTVRSVGDRTGEPLSPRRIRSAIGWAAGSVLLLTVLGAIPLPGLMPIWAALAGTALGWVIERIGAAVRR